MIRLKWYQRWAYSMRWEWEVAKARWDCLLRHRFNSQRAAECYLKWREDIDQRLWLAYPALMRKDREMNAAPGPGGKPEGPGEGSR